MIRALSSGRSPAVRAAVLLFVAGVLAPGPARAGLPGVPIEQWRWEGATRDPEFPVPDSTPVVLQLTDDDGDGRIDANDVPDVAFLHFPGPSSRSRARLTAVDGATGEPWFTVDSPAFGAPHQLQGAPMLAGGDVDGDGRVELIVTDGEQVIVLEHDGAWSGLGVAWPAPLRAAPVGQALALADLDQDGFVEAIAHDRVVSLGGALSWSGGVDGQLFSSFAHAVDLAPTRPGLELLVGNVLFGADGEIVWERPDIPPGTTAPADFDADGVPEIAHLSGLATPVVRLLGAGGADRAPPITLDSQPSTLTAADLDGDGRAEAVVFLAGGVHAFSWDGSALVPLWETPLDESCCGGAALFDFDGDGLPEIVYRADSAWYVLEGLDGTVLHAEALYSETAIEAPVIADIDHDCATEIVVAAWATGDFGPEVQSLVAYEVPGSRTARSIWNQAPYHVTNVSGDGTIPMIETPDWEGPGWFAQAPASCCRAVVLLPVEGASLCEGESVTLDASGVTFPSCAGALEYEWSDGAGVVGTAATLSVSPSATTDYRVTVTCADAADCRHEAFARVVVHHRPRFEAVTARDPSDCNFGIRLEWEAAAFGTALGGTYNVYKSTAPGATCADALSLPPVASGLLEPGWLDRVGAPEGPAVYVVEAEDAVAPSACSPRGPNGGAASRSCIESVVDEGLFPLPDGVGATLRASHSGDEVVLRWPAARPLLGGEHFHVMKAVGDPTGPFARVNEEGDLARSWTESDASSALQFFDLRVANGCEELSPDDFPPSRR